MSSNTKYRKLNYQIKYRADLQILDFDSITTSDIAEHFAKHGYEHLYLKGSRGIVAIVTFEDFLNGQIIEGVNRSFVRNASDIKNKESIEKLFIDYPELDRISVIDEGQLICEIDSLIEIPLQNGLAKNLMAIRYVDIFYQELCAYFSDKKKVLLLANDNIKEFFEEKFRDTVFCNYSGLDFEHIKSIEGEFDLVMDFLYCSNIRRILGFKSLKLENLSQIVLKIALKKLVEYCCANEIYLKTYKIQKYDGLTCLNESEYSNSINRIKAGKIIKEGSYLSKYEMSSMEHEYISQRMYQASLRLDDGFCFLQDDCDFPMLKVQDGVRSSSFSLKGEVQNVHFFGPCTLFGFLTPDDMTIPAHFAKYADENKKNINVFNYAGIHGYNELNAIMTALATPLNKRDIVIIFDALDDLEIEEYPDAKYANEWFNKIKKPEDTWFFDFPGHCNSKANSVIAENIYKDVSGLIKEESVAKDPQAFIYKENIRYDYLNMTHAACIKLFNTYSKLLVDSNKYSNIGAVVIPDGIIYEDVDLIINKCLSHCDALYVFKFNVNQEILDESKVADDIVCYRQGKPICFIQLGYYFYSKRYKNQEEKAYRIEKSLRKSIYEMLNIKTDFIIEDDIGNCNEIIKKVCSAEGIHVISLNI